MAAWWDEQERLLEEGYKDEQKRQKKIVDDFLAKAKAGDLYTYKFSAMTSWATDVRSDFEDHRKRFSIDPTAALIYLGEYKKVCKFSGLKSFKFLATNVVGHVASVWLDEESIEYICEYKR